MKLQSTYIMAVNKNPTPARKWEERRILTKKEKKKNTEPQGRRAVDKLAL